MYTNKLYELTEGTEVVIRYARGEKFAKGKVIKTTKTQLTIEYVNEEGRSFTERFNKSQGEQIGGNVYIGRMFDPIRLMSYSDADEEIKVRKLREAEEARKREESKKSAQNEFNKVIEKTQADRKSLTLIDEETQTYKIVVYSEQGKRILGIFKMKEDEYFNWDTSEYHKGLAANLAYSGTSSWSSRSTFNGKTFEEIVDKVVYELYKSW